MSPAARRLVAIGAAVVGVLLLVVAVVYWVEPASSLPSFFPGHEAGSGHHHVKHGIAAFLVGLALLAFAWFQTGGDGGRAGAAVTQPADQLLPGDRPRPAAGRHGALPDLESRAQRHPAPAPRLGHPPERRLLHHLPRRDAPGDRDRAARFFWQDWVRILAGLGRSLRDREIAADDADAKLGWLLVVGTIPAGHPRPAARARAARACSPRRSPRRSS